MALITADSVVLTVTEPTTVDGVTRYKVSVCLNNASADTLSYVHRRFSDFDAVFKRLVSMNPIPSLPELPPKRYFGSTDPAFIEERRLALQGFLRAVQSNRDLSRDPEFLDLIAFPPPGCIPTSADRACAILPHRDGESAPESVQGRTYGSSKGSSASELPLWIRPSLRINHETNILAAQGWLRSTPYRLVCLLPEMSCQRQSKTYAKLSSASGQFFILSIYQPQPTFQAQWESKLTVLYRSLVSLPATKFFLPETVLAEGPYLFVVRKFVPKGSLCDRLFDVKNPLDPNTIKYRGVAKGFSVDQLSRYTVQVAQTCQLMHLYNVPVPALHSGNIFIGDDDTVLLADYETPIAGCNWSPVVLPHTESPADDVTHIDVLRFGTLLVHLSSGMLPTLATESKLLSTVGAPWMPSWSPGDPDPSVNLPQASQASLRSGTQTTSSPGHGSANRGSRTKVPQGDFPELPPLVGDVVDHIFSARSKATWESVLARPLFNKVLASKKHRGSDAAPPSLGLKKKDVALFTEAAEAWQQYLLRQEEAAKRAAESRVASRELAKMRKRGGGAATAAVNAPPSPPESMAQPSAKAHPPSRKPVAAPPEAPSATTPLAPTPQSAPSTKAAPPPPPPGTLAKAPPPGPPPPPPPPSGKTNQPALAGPTSAPAPPPPPPPPKGGVDAARNAFLEEIRRGTKLTYRGD